MTRPATADHSRSAAVEIAAQFAADLPTLPSLQDLQRLHGISQEQAAEALAWARNMKICRAAFS